MHHVQRGSDTEQEKEDLCATAQGQVRVEQQQDGEHAGDDGQRDAHGGRHGVTR